jgi:hypothetical protein
VEDESFNASGSESESWITLLFRVGPTAGVERTKDGLAEKM